MLQQGFGRIGVQEVGRDGVWVGLREQCHHTRRRLETGPISVTEKPANGLVLDGPDGDARLRKELCQSWEALAGRSQPRKISGSVQLLHPRHELRAGSYDALELLLRPTTEFRKFGGCPGMILL